MENHTKSKKSRGGYREGAGRPSKEEYVKKHAHEIVKEAGTLELIEKRARLGMSDKSIALLVDTGLTPDQMQKCYKLQIQKGRAYLEEMLCEAAIAKVAEGNDKMIRYMCDVHLKWSVKADDHVKSHSDYQAEQSRLITDLLRKQLLNDEEKNDES